jgi:WD40 repeat protein
MKQLARVHRSQALVTCLKWMPNAGGIQSTMVTGAEDLRVRIWDVRTGLREIHTLEGYVYFPVSDRSHLCVYHYTTVTCGNVQLSLDVSPDGRYLLTSSKGFNGVGCEARVWDLRFSRAAVADSTADGGAVQQPILVHTYLGHTQDTGACAFLQQAVGGIPLFLTASKDESIRLWRQDDEQPSQIAQRVEVGSGAFTSLAVMPLRMDEPSLSSSGLDGPAFVVCSFNAGLYCYRVSPARQIVPLLRAEPSEPTY